MNENEQQNRKKRRFAALGLIAALAVGLGAGGAIAAAALNGRAEELAGTAEEASRALPQDAEPEAPAAVVAETLDYSIGDPLPTISDFVLSGEASLLSDLGEIDWTRPGTATVRLAAGFEVYFTEVRILDTTPPELALYACAVEPGEAVSPEDFVLRCSDLGAVTFAFREEPDVLTQGAREIAVVATDEAGNASEAVTELYVCEKVLRLEAGQDPISAKKLLKLLGSEYDKYSVPFSGKYVQGPPGAEAMPLTAPDGSEHLIGIQTRDTLPPEVTAAKVTCYTGYAYPPEYFVRSVSDGTAVALRFTEEPDWGAMGPVEFSLEAEDEAGNRTPFTVLSSIEEDTEPPRIRGAENRYCYVGQAVAYFSDVFVVDNNPLSECGLTVDKSAVDYRTVGSYPVTYTATDGEGNSTSVTVKFFFRQPSVSEEQLDELGERILSEIVTEDMTLCEKAEAVFKYVRSHVRYQGAKNGKKSDWMAVAYKALKSGRGDCYASAVCIRYFMQKIGADAMLIYRNDKWTNHTWNLVDLGTGWYHIDACRVAPDHGPYYMKTSKEMSSYPNGKFMWRYDPEQYPDVAEEPFEPF